MTVTKITDFLDIYRYKVHIKTGNTYIERKTQNYRASQPLPPPPTHSLPLPFNNCSLSWKALIRYPPSFD